MNHRTAQVALATTLASLAWSALAAAQPTGSAFAADTAQACVSGGACYPTLQQAITAAPTGGTVQLGAGEYAGGVVISRDLTLAGAGAAQTVVRGGGPVITVTASQSARPTVTISALTVTGGVARSFKGDSFNAAGGGILVAPPRRGLGATVLLSGMVVTGNATSPTSTSPSPSGVRCPHGFCPYAGSFGGGIASWGNLTVKDSTVSDNLAGGRSSDADGGGVYTVAGSVRIESSDIEGNRAAPDEIGRFAEGGGVFVGGGTRVDVVHTHIDANLADLTTHWPVKAHGKVIDMNANSGALHIGDGLKAHLLDVSMSRNAVGVDDPRGEPLAFDSAMLVGDSPLRMRDSVVAGNTVRARVRTSADVGLSGTTLETDGAAARLSHVRIVENRAEETTRRGPAQASNGFAVYNFTDHDPGQVVLTHSLIAENAAVATSRRGSASVRGAGMLNDSLLRLVDVAVRDNHARAIGNPSLAQGGGIWNGPLLTGPPVRLVVRGVRVEDNSVRARGGRITGGGIYTTVPIASTGLRVHGNRPDQCHGCD